MQKIWTDTWLKKRWRRPISRWKEIPSLVTREMQIKTTLETLVIISSFTPLWLDNILRVIWILLSSETRFMDQHTVYPGERSVCTWEECVSSYCWVECATDDCHVSPTYSVVQVFYFLVDLPPLSTSHSRAAHSWPPTNLHWHSIITTSP